MPKWRENYKCYCGRLGDVDEFGQCSECFDEQYVLGHCRNCVLFEFLKDGEICSYCEKDGVRCDTCGVWMIQRTHYDGSIKRVQSYATCTKCSTHHCEKCFTKHINCSCWSCAKIDCSRSMKRCKTCKHKLCEDCSTTGYCNLCWMKLLGYRSAVKFPKDILNLLQVECRGKQPNPLLKSKCTHLTNKYDGLNCPGCNTDICEDCLTKHRLARCPKCLNLCCADKTWRTCFSCSGVICNYCPSGSVHRSCCCKSFKRSIFASSLIDDVELGSPPPEPDW